MNLFSQSGNNTCLWILLLLLLAVNSNGSSLQSILNGSCTPILIALIYTMWKNGTLSTLFCGTGGTCGCNV